MKTFTLKAMSNYGELVYIVNAETETDALEIVRKDNTTWDVDEVEELDTHTKGLVFIGGGDGG